MPIVISAEVYTHKRHRASIRRWTRRNRPHFEVIRAELERECQSLTGSFVSAFGHRTSVFDDVFVSYIIHDVPFKIWGVRLPFCVRRYLIITHIYAPNEQNPD